MGWLLFVSLVSSISMTGWTQTAPPAPWRFAFFSDGRSDRRDDPGAAHGVRWASIKAIAAHAASQQAELIVFPGDLSNGATNFGTLTEQWTAWTNDMSALYQAGIGVFCTKCYAHEVAKPVSQAAQGAITLRLSWA